MGKMLYAHFNVLVVFGILYSAGLFFSLIAGAAVLARNPGKRVNQSFFGFFLALAVLTLLSLLILFSNTRSVVQVLVRLQSAWVFLFPALISLVLAYNRAVYKRIGWVLNGFTWLPAVVFFFTGIHPPWSTVRAVRSWWGWHAVTGVGPMDLLLATWAIICSLLALGIIVHYYKTLPDGSNRHATRLLLVGVFIPVFTGMLQHPLQKALGFRVPDLSILAFVLGGCFIAWGIYRHQLFSLSFSAVADDVLKLMVSSVFLTDTKGVIITVNQSAELLLNVTAAELKGRLITAFITDAAFCPEKVAVEKTLHADSSIQGGQKDPIPVSLTAAWLSNDRSSLSGIVYTALDLRDRVQREQEREQMEEALFQARKMESLGLLAGGLAHDFNNMLSAILGFSSLIERQEYIKGTPAAEWAETIRSTTLRASGLTRNLLSFARKGRLNNAVLNIHEILTDVGELLERLTDNRNIRLELRLNSERFHVLGDPGQLQNAILNITVNARDAITDSGDISIETDTVRLDNIASNSRTENLSGDYIRITIRDSGSGIPREVQDRMFEPFYTTKSKNKGTGLGLSGALGAIHAHEGVLTFDSEMGKGTTFYLHLPLTAMEMETEPSPVQARVATSGNHHILIVDDEVAVSRYVRDFLQIQGHTTSEVSNGLAALDYLADPANKPDLVLLDVIMPEMDGYACLTEIKKHYAGLPVVLMTGFSEREDCRTLAGKGVAAFLSKPFTLEELAQTVTALLNPSAGG